MYFVRKGKRLTFETVSVGLPLRQEPRSWEALPYNSVESEMKTTAGERSQVEEVMVVVTIAFSSPARTLGEGWTIHSLPALFFFFKWRLAHAH